MSIAAVNDAPGMMQPAEWRADGFEFGSFHFLPVNDARIATIQAAYPSFILMKDAALIRAHEENLPKNPGNLLELGIMRGGSCALFEGMLRPRNHLAIDVHQFPGDGLAELTDHVAAQGRTFRADYQTSQSDVGRILSLWDQVCGSREPFDVVIDDASHSYGLSLAAFNGLFPHVRPGGVYVVEDWGWAHWNGPWQDRAHPEFNEPALSNLVMHAGLAVTGGGGIVASVKITPGAAFIVRGSASCDGFNIEESYVNRGRARLQQ